VNNLGKGLTVVAQISRLLKNELILVRLSGLSSCILALLSSYFHDVLHLDLLFNEGRNLILPKPSLDSINPSVDIESLFQLVSTSSIAVSMNDITATFVLLYSTAEPYDSNSYKPNVSQEASLMDTMLVSNLGLIQSYRL